MSEANPRTLTSRHYNIAQHGVKQASNDQPSAVTTSDRSCHHQCLNCGNVEVSTQDLHSCFETALQSMRQSLTNATVEYLQLGSRYFDIPSKARASTSPTNPAHSQYGIEGRRWMDDPFLFPWIQATQVILQIEEKLESEKLNTGIAGRICEEIEEARTIVRSVVGALGSLEEGVEQIEDRERLQTFENWLRKGALTRTVDREERNLEEGEKQTRGRCRQKRVREALFDAERRELPRMAFEQAKFERWQRRIEGVEQMG